MSPPIRLELSGPEELELLRLPVALDLRLEHLLDRQDRGEPISDAERAEAEGLVDVAELLTLLGARALNEAP
jgi:hypothetical protein